MRDKEEKINRQRRRGIASLKRRQGKDHRMVHHLIKETAEGLAGAYYEHAASHQKHGNVFYEAFPDVGMFVKYQWRYFIKAANSILLDMLNNLLTPEPQKQEIYHALLLDGTLPYIGAETQIVNIPN